jgi:lysyl-tRNA synthetase class 2
LKFKTLNFVTVTTLLSKSPPNMADTMKDAVEGIVEQVKDATIGSSTGEAAASNAPNLQKDEETGEMVSKSELKKRQKARQAAAKKAEKAAAAPPPKEKSKDKLDMSDLNPNVGILY